jgi:hypothetical protein
MAGCKRGGTVAMCAAERGGIRLSPCVLVSIFIYCNMLNYVDRGLVNGTLPEYCVDCRTKPDELSCRKENSCDWQTNACAFNTSVVPRLGIGGSFGIKETAQGVVAGSFMGGYCVFSPIFAYLSTVYKPFTLMGLGLTAWYVHVCLCCSCDAARIEYACKSVLKCPNTTPQVRRLRARIRSTYLWCGRLRAGGLRHRRGKLSVHRAVLHR